MTKSTFERAVEPRVADPEPRTPGPYMRHGVMVRDTVETLGGMFGIRRAGEAVTIGGKPFRKPEEFVAFAYKRGDADLLAAAPDMLAALMRAETRLYVLAHNGADVPADDVAAIKSAIAKAEGRR